MAGCWRASRWGLSEGGGERLSRSYAYNSFGDITALTEETTSYTFGYDGLGRLTSAYGRTYSYDGANRLTTFNGQSYGYGDAGPYHAVDRIGDFDRFDYDANGNMVTRNKGLDSQQTLVWNAENRLSEVQDNDGDVVERYWYGVGGSRVKKTSGTTTTYTFFGHYEEEVTGGVTTAISHYSFGGLRIAVKRGSALYHLHGDHLGSTSLTTAGSVVEASRAYYAYGAERAATGDLQTDRTFTGQKADGTGLMYYNARYYDPALGTFVSPDTLVPGAGQVINYNRFLYARGNPLKYSDPTGHDALGPAWVQEFKDNHGGRAPNEQDRVDRYISLHLPGLATGSRTWTDRDWIKYATTFPHRGFPVLAAGGSPGSHIIGYGFSNQSDELSLLKEGYNDLDAKIGGGDTLAGFLGSPQLQIHWTRRTSNVICQLLATGVPLACTFGTFVEFYDALFVGVPTKDEYKAKVKGTAVHEIAHVVHYLLCLRADPLCYEIVTVSETNRLTNHVTNYGAKRAQEYWAESVADWVYGATGADGYWANEAGRKSILGTPIEDVIHKVFGLPAPP